MKKTSIQEEMYSQFHCGELFEQAQSYTYAYMDGVYNRNVFPVDEAIKKLDSFDEPLPTAPSNPDEILLIL